MQFNQSHLTYCMNIHPGESYTEVEQAILDYAIPVKARVSPNRRFGLGLRLSRRAASQLRGRIGQLRQLLEQLDMYVFTVNGFPYGEFHQSQIKEQVYCPDWSDRRRVSYTLSIARILAELLPAGVDGSISTVPLCYGKKPSESALLNLLRTEQELARISRGSGRNIYLGLEPEPDCLLEEAGEIAEFWQKWLAGCQHIGLCFDLCHFATNFESPVRALQVLLAARVPIVKVQVSSSLMVDASSPPRRLLAPFDDGIYLHQVRIRDGDGEIHRYPDLAPALAAGPGGQWRIHFHVPLDWPGGGGLHTTRSEISSQFLALAIANCHHFEVETYTFHVMPGMDRKIDQSIAGELEWLISKMAVAESLANP